MSDALDNWNGFVDASFDDADEIKTTGRKLFNARKLELQKAGK